MVILLIFYLAREGERTGYAVDAPEGTVTGGNHRGVRRTFEFGIAVNDIAHQMSGRERQRIQIFHQRPHLIAVMLPVGDVGDTIYALPRLVLIEQAQQLHDSLLGFTVYNDRTLIDVAVLVEITGTGSHEQHPCLRCDTMDTTGDLDIVLHGEVNGPHAVHLSRLLTHQFLQLVDRQGMVDAVEVGYRVQLLHAGSHLQFVDIRRRIDHTCTTRTAFSRMFTNHHGRN